jgi:cystathionine beta-lyase
MAGFDFDPPLRRLRARSDNKWRRHGPDVLPAWIADMDFDPPPCVVDALGSALQHGDLGYYGDRLDLVSAAFSAWQHEQHGWEPDPEQMFVTDDVMTGLAACLLAWCPNGEAALVSTPTYPPFLEALADTPARGVDVPLRRSPRGWELDVDELASAAARERARVLLLCNPHNPTGRAFARGDLEQVAEIAAAHDLVVVADEVWADLVYAPHVHVPFATVSPDAAERSITLSGPSKSFNLGGMRCAVTHFGTPALRETFLQAARPYLGTSNALAVTATLAAWEHGGPWLDALRRRLVENRARVAAVLSEALPEVDFNVPDATYLAWFGCERLALPAPPAEHLLKEGKVALYAGSDFGPSTEHWARLNFATSPSILDAVLERVVDALRT